MQYGQFFVNNGTGFRSWSRPKNWGNVKFYSDEPYSRGARGRLSHSARTAFEGRETVLRQW